LRQLENKIAIVTGAAGGIGAATALLLGARGASVVLADINLDAAEKVARLVEKQGGSAMALRLDLSSEDAIAAMIRATLAEFGRIDVLHNNAADQSPELTGRDRDIESMEAEVWDRTFRVNVRGTMLCCKHALPHMVANGGGSMQKK